VRVEHIVEIKDPMVDMGKAAEHADGT
jgi:hypothetical protein